MLAPVAAPSAPPRGRAPSSRRPRVRGYLVAVRSTGIGAVKVIAPAFFRAGSTGVGRTRAMCVVRDQRLRTMPRTPRREPSEPSSVDELEQGGLYPRFRARLGWCRPI